MFSCKIFLYASRNCTGSGKIHKRSGGHHVQKDEFFGVRELLTKKNTLIPHNTCNIKKTYKAYRLNEYFSAKYDLIFILYQF
jgi:hypothetical protein